MNTPATGRPSRRPRLCGICGTRQALPDLYVAVCARCLEAADARAFPDSTIDFSREHPGQEDAPVPVAPQPLSLADAVAAVQRAAGRFVPCVCAGCQWEARREEDLCRVCQVSGCAPLLGQVRCSPGRNRGGAERLFDTAEGGKNYDLGTDRT